MAYFPNGSAHTCYIETVCSTCIHFKDDGDGRGYGCPIIDLHFLYNYDQFTDPALAAALDLFIPQEEDEFGLKTINGQCTMYAPDPDHQDPTNG